MRLIDADKFRMEILVSANRENYGSGCDDHDDGCISASENLLATLDAFPTVDAAPVVHAHWDDSYDGITPVCTSCGRTHHCMTRCPKFCPSCGAKMDEEVPYGEA